MLLRTLPFLLLAACASAGEAVVTAKTARVHSTGRAEDGHWNLWDTGGHFGDWFVADKPGKASITIRAAGQPARKVWPVGEIHLIVPGKSATLVGRFTAAAADFKDYTLPAILPKGAFGIQVGFTNDFLSPDKKEDRNLFVQQLRVSGAALAPKVPVVTLDTAEDIRKNRMGTLTVQTRPGAAVTVTQLQHEFWFGTCISRSMFREMDAPDTKKYLEVLKANFNSVVHENALKWYGTGKEPHGADYTDADRMTDWCIANGLRVRGHCAYWGIEQYVQAWLKALDDGALRKAIETRGRAVSKHFKGRIGEYDVNNEMMHGDYYAKRLGKGITADMFRWVGEGDPQAILYVNDYGILQSGGEAYAKHIQALLDRGIQVGGIGIQGHVGKSVRPERVKATLDRLAKFGLPIKITEFDMNTKDEEAKARELEALYRVCFAHPAVEGVLMWGFWRGRHWRPDAALWQKDWSPTPAAETYHRLVYDEWWTRFEGKADAQGRCEVPVYFGRHKVEAGGKALEVDIAREEGKKTVKVGGSR